MHNGRVIDWNDLRYLLAVARGGSTAAAARELGVNQSTVVRRIDALEEALNLRLFDRKRDGYRTTAEGAALVEEARAVEVSVLTLTRRAASLDEKLTGALRVTIPEGLALSMLSPMFEKFERRYPGMKINLVVDNRVLDLDQGQIDVALRAGNPLDQSLVGRKFAEVAWAVYGAPSLIDLHGRPKAPEDLNNHRIVGFDGPLENIPVARWLQQVAPRAEITCRCHAFFALFTAAQAGLGFALLPCSLGDPAADLVRVLDPVPGLTGPMWLLTHPDLHKTPKVRAFFEFMATEIEPYKPLLLGLTRPKGDAQRCDEERAGAAARRG